MANNHSLVSEGGNPKNSCFEEAERGDTSWQYFARVARERSWKGVPMTGSLLGPAKKGLERRTHGATK